MEDFLANLVRCNRAIYNAPPGRTYVPREPALPKGLGYWRATLEFVLGPFACGKDLDEVSAMDVARSAERNVDAFCREGVGTLLAKLAAGLPIQFSTPVKGIDWGAKWVEVQTVRGDLRTRAVIITASTGVLAPGHVRVYPQVAEHHVEANWKLGLGRYDHRAIRIVSKPAGPGGEDLGVAEGTDTWYAV